MSRASRSRTAVWGVAGALLLIAAAITIPAATGWNVHVRWFAPLHAEWMPRIGPGTPLAVLLGAAGVIWGPRVARHWRWGRLLAISIAASALWLFALATVDGLDGIGVILDHRYEYLNSAREIDDVPAMLHEYVSRIPFAHEHNWPVHLAGHPPGAVLFFIALVRIGLGSGLSAGFVVLAVGATAVLAVLIALRALGAERQARAVAPFLVFSPAAIWIAVSADGVFLAVAAWGLCALALAVRADRERRLVALAAWSVAAGLLLGYLVMMSYGMPLMGAAAVAVLVAGRSWRPLPIVAVVALGVVLAFASAGFAWWEALPVLQQRYWDGVASNRPPQYWMWGNLAAFAVSAGPAIGAALLAIANRSSWPVRGVRSGMPDPAREQGRRVVLLLCSAGFLMVLLADLSQMSRAEVERIWLPFVPWATLGLALFPERTRQWLLAVQVGFAIVVQSLLHTGW